MVRGVRQYFDQGLRHFLLFSHEVQHADEALAGLGDAAAHTPPRQGEAEAGLLCALFAYMVHPTSGWVAQPSPSSICHLVRFGWFAEGKGKGKSKKSSTPEPAAGSGGVARDRAPRRPSDLYGAEHLVRLLVKLPELVPVAYMTPPVRARSSHGLPAGCW
jgi:hypothetical protein